MYVHIPFCQRRCDYCAFATWTDREQLWERYVAACRAQVRRAASPSSPRGPATSVFFGGGTPSLLPADLLLGILEALREGPGVADGRRGYGRVQPRDCFGRQARRLPSGRSDQVVLWGAVDGAARPGGSGQTARPLCCDAGGPAGWRGRLRRRVQRRPHLRGRRRDRCRLAGVAARSAGTRAGACSCRARMP